MASAKDVHEIFTQQSIENGCRISKVKPSVIPGKGIGIMATESIDPGEEIVMIPHSLLISKAKVPSNLSNSLPGASAHGLLTAFLVTEYKNAQSSIRPWCRTWPSPKELKHTVPICWSASEQALLPEEAKRLLGGQIQNRDRDFISFHNYLPSISESLYTYFWLLVNTRSFYYDHFPKAKWAPRADRMALCPFVDYFNHADSGCSVTFDAEGLKVVTNRLYNLGDEVVVSYGSHSNDFLLVEYGFVLGENKWDSAILDSTVISSLMEQETALLSVESLLGDYRLDRTGLCFRTESVLWLQLLSIPEWKRFLRGEAIGEGKAQSFNGVTRKLLHMFGHTVVRVQNEIQSLSPDSTAKLALTSRWAQIKTLQRIALELYGD